MGYSIHIGNAELDSDFGDGTEEPFARWHVRDHAEPTNTGFRSFGQPPFPRIQNACRSRFVTGYRTKGKGSEHIYQATAKAIRRIDPWGNAGG
jgi:hypothetical protein